MRKNRKITSLDDAWDRWEGVINMATVIAIALAVGWLWGFMHGSEVGCLV